MMTGARFAFVIVAILLGLILPGHSPRASLMGSLERLPFSFAWNPSQPA